MTGPAASTAVIAVAQFAPTDDVAANLQSIERLVASAAARGGGLVVLPEYSTYFTPIQGPDWVEHAEPLDGPTVTALAAIADRHEVVLVAGVLETAGSHNRVRNTVVALRPGRGIVAAYRKLHLYDAFGQRESDWVEPGAVEAPELFEWGGFTVGLQTCYDIRFPEVSRRIVDAGADLLLVPAEWVRGPLKEHHWRTLLTARALENTVYLAAADHTPPVGVGTSLVIDPMGVAVAALGEAEGIAVAELDPARVAAVREVNPALRLRRFGVTAP
jgi:predicted amidohydrolase